MKAAIVKRCSPLRDRARELIYQVWAVTSDWCADHGQKSPHCPSYSLENLWLGPYFEAQVTAALGADTLAGLKADLKAIADELKSNDDWKDSGHEVQADQKAAGKIQNTDDVGLMRCNRSGSRQLHEWADGKYRETGGGEVAIACECAT